VRLISWAEISDKSDKLRNDFVQKYLEKSGIENSLEYIETPLSNLKEATLEAQNKFDYIRVHPNFGIDSLHLFAGIPSEMMTVGAMDAWIRADKKKWWPRNFYFKAFHGVISKQGSKINLNSEVLIIGTGAVAKAFLVGFVKLGFKKINISSTMDEAAQEFVESSKQFFFDVKLSYVPQSRLVTLPGVHGIMVNTTPIDKNSEMIEDLSYFNFLQKSGLVIDANLVPLDSLLLTEAISVGANIIPGYEFMSAADALWMQELSGKKIQIEDYTSYLLEQIQNQNPETSVDNLS
tara:strand:- start:38280 stop:39155 length:876 start_codon:yes stop_codon:yes gene_type:complete